MLLPPKSAKTFHESLQILSPLRKSAKYFHSADFRGKSLQTLEVITIQTLSLTLKNLKFAVGSVLIVQ